MNTCEQCKSDFVITRGKQRFCSKQCRERSYKDITNPYYNGEKLTANGYKTIRVNGKTVTEHRYLYEQAFGKIPKGYDIHHIDGNKLHNELSNFKLINKAEHSLLHTPLYRSETQKECSKCHVIKDRSEFHLYGKKRRISCNNIETHLSYCKECRRAKNRQVTQRYRLKLKQTLQA